MPQAQRIQVLLVDDEASTRLLLRRWIERGMIAEVAEASDGLQALELIAGGAVEMLISDIRMPVLDGVELLNLLQADPIRDRLEILVASQVAAESTVQQVISLGVSDYLLKPLDYKRVMGRIQLAAERILSRRAQNAENAAHTPMRILVADPDPNYCSFAEATLEGEFAFKAVRRVADTLVKALKWHPDVMLLSPSLPGLGVSFLIERLRSVQAGRDVRVLLLGDKSDAGADSEHIDGIVSRTFVPEALRGAIRQLLSGSDAPKRGLLSWVGSLDAELVTALQQSLGMMAGSEAKILDEMPADASFDLFERIVVKASAGDFELQLMIRCRQELAGELWNAMLGGDDPVPEDESRFDSLREILNVVAGRVKNSCLERRIEMEIGLPEISREECSQPPRAQHEAVRHCLWQESHYFELSMRAYLTAAKAVDVEENDDAAECA